MEEPPETNQIGVAVLKFNGTFFKSLEVKVVLADLNIVRRENSGVLVEVLVRSLSFLA